ncbi:MAG TPA: response regulator transcription factor, partial [Steroidobacteraceae bacterium]|nr:response regulator transcription factor [Steroidobacteraceae bacterium]
GTLAFGSGARYLALLAVALRRHAEARELFEEAIEFNARIGAAPLLAQTRVEYAALLLQSELEADLSRAREMLARARVAAQELDMRTLLARIEELDTERRATQDLTDRELAVLRLIAAGESNKQIARTLFVSHSTVATHIRNILRKTATRNRTEAVAYARRCQLIPDG